MLMDFVSTPLARLARLVLAALATLLRRLPELFQGNKKAVFRRLFLRLSGSLI